MKKNLRNFVKRPTGQLGFIQNLIIPGIILIGVVIAGISLLSNSGSSTDTTNERASMLANVVLTQSVAYVGAIQRAEADGGMAATSALAMGSLTSGKYMVALPVIPSDLANSGVWAYDPSAAPVYVVTGSGGANIGTAAAENVLTVVLGNVAADVVANAVCLRINNKLYGTSTVAGTTVGVLTTTSIKPPVGTGSLTGTEGCVADATKLYYYKVVNTK